MKGIIFNLLEEAVTAQYGYAMWDRMLAVVCSDGAYTALGTYPDAEVQLMIDAAARQLAIPSSDVLRWFGNAAMPILLDRYPQFDGHRGSARDLLLRVNSVIHPEALRSIPGASVPVFDFSEAPGGGLTLVVRSTFPLCSLAEGFSAGVATFFGERIAFTHRTCVLHGDRDCVAHIGFVS